jgi:hypothetical protein
MEYALDALRDPAVAVERLERMLAGAEEEVLLSGPARVLAAVEPVVRAAHERGVVVFLLVGNDDPGADGPGADLAGADDSDADGHDADALSADLAGAATVVHAWPAATDMVVVCTVDRERGLCAMPTVFERETDGSQGAAFVHPVVCRHVFGTVMGNEWHRSPEVHVADPRPLPATYDSFTAVLIDAAHHLEAGRAVRASARGRWVGTDEAVTVEGRLCNVRQGFVEPVTNSFPIEGSLLVRDGDELVSVGGPGAFVEDVVAEEVRFDALGE